jgi:hypothetical protein
MNGVLLLVGAGIFPFATISGLVLVPIQLSIKRLLAAFVGVKQVAHDSDSSSPSSA